METTTRLLLPEVTELLRDNPSELIELTEELHPADLADLAEALEPELAQKLIELLPVEVAASLFEYVEDDQRVEMFQTIARSSMQTAVAVTDRMAHDERADLYGELPDELRKDLLDQIEDDESRDIRQLMSYPEDTAGALLTTDFVALPASATAAQAIDLVRKNAAEMETIYQAYAVDSHDILLGVVSLRDLVTAPADRTIDAIMNPKIVSVDVSDDQEVVARQMAKYDLLAIPVVDRSHCIVGIITFDDVMDVVEEEATEDAQKMGAVDPLETPYMNTPMWVLIKARAPWLITLFIGVMATANVLEFYAHSAVAATAVVMWFVPMIISSGGNSGAQSATLIIRAMAIGRITGRDTAKILRRELLVGWLLGLMLAVVGIGRVMATASTRSIEMAATVGLALMSVVTLGALLGSGVPLLLNRLGIDPAVSSTPFIASVLDLTGLLVYFEIARLFLT